MSSLNAYERKKDPEKVRAALIDAAAAIVVEQGLAKLTIESVATAAGVTKGGLFHHFATKQALIDGLLDAMTTAAATAMEATMADDPEPQGRFTRAYLNGVLGRSNVTDTVSARALCMAMIADPRLPCRWHGWIDQQLALHAQTDSSPGCIIARLAADGLWLTSLDRPDDPPVIDPAVRDALFALTRATP